MSADEFFRRRRAKNIAIALTIVAMCVLFFVITVVRMSAAVH